MQLLGAFRDVGEEMGACLTLEREEGKARRRSEEIDRQLGELAKQQNNVIKILLLGKKCVLSSYLLKI